MAPLKAVIFWHNTMSNRFLQQISSRAKKLVTTQGNHKGLPLRYEYFRNEPHVFFCRGNPLWLP